jgi:ABC-type iron transport system FetAB ATPase subunit
MIPDDCPRIHITAHLKCFGFIAAEIQGYAYSLEDRPLLDVVTFQPDDGDEIEMAGPYGTPVEDAIRNALKLEAESKTNRSRLEEAFNEYMEGKREAALENVYRLRSEAAE